MDNDIIIAIGQPLQIAEFVFHLNNLGGMEDRITFNDGEEDDPSPPDRPTVGHESLQKFQKELDDANGAIRDTAGMLYDPAIHSTSKDGSPALKKDGTFKARRGLQQQPPAAKKDGVEESPQDANTSIADTNIVSLPQNTRAPSLQDKSEWLYVLKDANGQKFSGSTVKTAREFTTMLVEQLTAVRDHEIHNQIIKHNKPILERLLEEKEEALLDEIDAVAIDDL